MTWTVPAPPTVDGATSGDERAVLAGYLDWQRATMLNICAGLSAEQLALASAPPSTLTLLGLLRHLTKVDRTWFRQRASREELPTLCDPFLGRDADFEALVVSEPREDHTRLLDQIRSARAAADLLSLDDEFLVGEDVYSLRFVYMHMIAEYARHNGRADLLRQRIDGVTAR
jgi:hypothetical protein